MALLFYQTDERDWRGRSEGAAAQDGWQSKQPAASGAASTQATSTRDASKGDDKSNAPQKGPAAASAQASALPNAQVCKLAVLLKRPGSSSETGFS